MKRVATTKWSELRQRLVPADQDEAAAASQRALRDALGLAGIRAGRRLTQVELAARLGKSQGNVSELERRSDMYLSSLREYVAALGGELEISAVFGDERHPIIAPNLEKAMLSESIGGIGRARPPRRSTRPTPAPTVVDADALDGRAKPNLAKSTTGFERRR